MHDPSSTAYYQGMIMKQPEFPEQEQQLKCPRCDSTNTKFCYYNNYNLSQPRHFCKSCRRYWTKGGALRNIPVGGGSRKNTKRSGSGSSSSSGNPKKTHFVRNPYPDPGRSSGTHDPAPSSSSSESLRFGLNPMARISGFLGNPGQDPTRIYGLPIGGDQGLDIGGSFSSLLASNMQLGGILDGLNGNGSGPDLGMGIRGIDGSNGRDGWTDLSMNTGGSSFQ